LTSTYADPTKAAGRTFVYLAKNAIKDKEIKPDENEDIEVLVKSKDEVMKMIKDGEISVSDSIAGFFLALEELKK
jgi:adenine-specific DNA methylase